MLFFTTILFAVCFNSQMLYATKFSKSNHVIEEKYPIISYESLDISTMECIKRAVDIHGNTRDVYSDGKVFYKIWNQKYSHCGRFLRALKSGFFDQHAKIIALIYDKERICRGYVCPKGIPLSQSNKTLHYSAKNDMISFFPASMQPELYQQFYSSLIHKSLTTQLIYFDFNPHNLIVYENAVYLIDLESTYSINELNMLKKTDRGSYEDVMKQNPTDYKEFILHMTKEAGKKKARSKNTKKQ